MKLTDTKSRTCMLLIFWTSLYLTGINYKEFRIFETSYNSETFVFLAQLPIPTPLYNYIL